MGPPHLTKLRQRTHHQGRYHYSIRGLGINASQCHYCDIFHLQADERVTITVTKCLCLDDMARAPRIVCNGIGMLSASP